MAQLNFPDPNITTVYENAGIIWTWNSSLGVWSSESEDGDTVNSVEWDQITDKPSLVNRIIAGNNITISPGAGTGEVLSMPKVAVEMELALAVVTMT